MNILLIEDDAGLVELISMMLKDLGFSVISVTSGSEALAHLKKQTPDLILLDYSLPDINGKELIETLIKQQTPPPPFIITTGQGNERIAVDMMKLGAIDYLIKDMLFLEKLPDLVKRVIKEIKSDGKLKQVEKKLKESEEKYRTIIETIPGAVYECDMDWNFLFVSHGFKELTGFPASDVINNNIRTFVSLMFEDDIKRITPSLDEALKRKDQFYFSEYKLRTKSRKIVWVHDSVRILYNMEGKAIGYKGVLLDITEQKKAEEKLKESKERFELAMAASKDGLFDWNLVTNEIYYSPGWKSMLGYKDEELPNDFSVWEKLTKPEDVKKSWEMQQELINKQRDRFELEFKMKHKDGHWVDILSRAEATFDDKGKAIRMVGTHVDISERKQEEKILDVELNLFEYAINHSEVELLQKFLDEAEKLTGSEIGFYHYIEDDQESISLQTWSTNTLNNMCKGSGDASRHYPISKAGVWVDCVKERKPVIHNDYSSLAHKKGLPEGHAPIIRELVVPVIRGNQIKAVLGVGNKKSDYTESDVYSIQRFADVAWETVVRKRAEEKIRIAEEAAKINEKYYENIINNMGDPVFVKDQQSKFLLVNDAFCKVVNLPRDKIIGTTLAEDIPHDEQEHFLRIDKQVLLDGHDNIIEESLTIKDKETLLVSTRKTRFTDKNGDKFLVGVIRDITEQKKAESNIRKLSTAVQQSPSIIIMADSKGIIEYVNPKFTELTGYKNSEVIGLKTNILKSGEQDSAFYKEMWDTINSTKTWRGQFHNKKKNGELFWEAASISAILNESGNVINYIKIGEDITQQKNIETELKIALEKALESDRLKSAFLANMSHEIRTPMNGILGFVNLLSEPDLQKDQIDQYSAIINKSSKRLLNTINDIIDISKIEAGEMVVSKIETSLNIVLDEIYSFHSSEAKLKGLSLILKPSLSTEPTTIITDSNKLYGILTNLVKNAIKYTHQGSIIFGYTIKDNFIEFFVKDTGIGIPRDRIQAIFNRFEQADIEDTRAFEGSGLGLTISRAYTEMLGGKLSVESEEGIGSKFIFTIPYVKTIKKEIEQPPEDIIYNPAKIKKLNLLIVEDEEVSAELLEVMLEDMFKKINFARTGIEAVEICRKNPEIDLVLMDVKLPEMDGYTATRKIRKFNKNIIIIAQTAYALLGDKEKAIEAGCNDYISKPIDKKLLLEMINKQVG